MDQELLLVIGSDIPQTNSPTPMLKETIAQIRVDSRHLAALLCLLALIPLMRLRTYHEPLERDIGIYAVAANEIIHGRILYKDLWDTKPPGIYLTYAAAQLVAGYGDFHVYLLNVAGAWLLLLGIYSSARVCSGPRAGLWSAFFYAIVSGDILLQANQPNSELFINALLSWTFFASVLAARTRDMRFFIMAGFLSGMASLFKQFALLPLFMMACASLLTRDGRCIRTWLGYLLSSAAAAACWLPVAAYFSLHGALDDFVHMNFEYPFFYAGLDGGGMSPPGKLLFMCRHFKALFIDSMWSILPLLLAAFAGVAFTRRGRTRWMPWIAFLISALAMIILPWKFYPHYYQLMLPAACIGAGWALADLSDYGIANVPGRWRRSDIACAALSILLLAIQIPAYFMPSEWWSQRKYGALFIYCREIGREIADATKEDERFFQWGYEGSLYYYAKRRPATGRFFNAPFLFGERRGECIAATIREFEESPPALVVLPGAFSKDHPLMEWILARYEPLGSAEERRRLEQAMAAKNAELCGDIRPLAFQNPPVPPMHFYIRKSTK